jgi:hypothetical protein
VNADLRASLIAAGTAAVLSSLIGLIAGVGLLALVLRALIGGLFFGAAVYGLILLAKRFLPGLLSASEGDETPAFQGPEPSRGARVDIVLPGEGLEPIGQGEGGGGSFGRAAGALDGGMSAEEASLLEPDGLVSETEAAIPPSAGRASSEEGASSGILGSSQAGQQASDSGHRPSSNFEDLDVLPDLEGFTDTFAASEFGAKAAEARPAATSSQASSGSRDGMDPAALAQAVRTILKRDQKG